MFNRWPIIIGSRCFALASIVLICAVPAANAQLPANNRDAAASIPQPEILSDLIARYPAGSIHSLEQASRAGEDIHKMHAIIEEQFSNEKKICFPKFFATACLSDAKERHRQAVAQVRSIEIEVNKLKRRENVLARDKAVAEKREKEVAELPSQTKEEQATAAAQAVKPTTSTTTTGNVRSGAKNKHIEKHELKIKQRESAAEEDAKKRVDNIAAYEKKRRESEARQRELAIKKSEKERAISGKEAQQAK